MIFDIKVKNGRNNPTFSHHGCGTKDATENAFERHGWTVVMKTDSNKGTILAGETGYEVEVEERKTSQ